MIKKITSKNSFYLILFLALSLLFFLFLRNKLLFTPDFGESDAYHYNLSFVYHLWSNLHQNTLSFQSGSLQGGYPLVMSVYVLNILNFFILRLFPFVIAYNLLFISVFFLLSAGFYLLLKEFKVNSLLAFLISLSLAFNGTVSFRLVHLTVIQTFSLTPFLFLVSIRYIKTKSKKYLLLFPLILSQMFFYTFVQVVFIVLLALFLFLIVYLKNEYKEKITTIIQVLLKFLLMVTVGVFLALPYIFQMNTLTKFSLRNTSVDYDSVTALPFETKNILNFIFPYVFGNPKQGTYAPFGAHWGIFWENTPYVGLVFATLFIISLIIYLLRNKDKNKKRFILFNIIIIVFFILLVLGKNSPLYVLYNFPPFNFFRTQSRFLLTVNFFIFLTSAITLNYLYKISHRFFKFILIVLLIVNVVGLVLVTKNYHLFLDAKRVLEVPKLALKINGDYRYLSEGQNTLWNKTFIKKGWSKDKDIEDYLFFKNFLYPNSNLFYGKKIYDNQTSYGLKLKRQEYLRGLIVDNLLYDKQKIIVPENVSQLASLLNISYLILPLDIQSDNLVKIDEVKRNSNKIVLYRIKNSQQTDSLIYFPSEVTKINYLSEFEDLFNKDNDFSVKAVVEDADFHNLSQNKADFSLNKKIVKDEYVYLDAKFAKSIFVAVKKNYYPGWELYINGKKSKIYKTNLVDIGFFVPKGKSTIVLRYINQDFRKGVIVAIISLIIYLLILYKIPRSHSGER